MQTDTDVNITAFNSNVETASKTVSLQALSPQHVFLTDPGFHNATEVVFTWDFTSDNVCQEYKNGTPDIGWDVIVLMDELDLTTVPIPQS